MAFTTKKILDDKYEIIHEIKQGGFGIVYYGIDNKLNKPVAIKEITPSLLEDPKYLDMFQEEALNIAKLSHNNIVHIYELKKTSDGRLCIIMEYIDGRDLEKIIRVARKNGMKLPPHLAVYIIAEVCMALDYAHHRRDAFTNKPLNLVHQDISPSNIMISRYGAIKLIDFGIASVKRHQVKEKRDTKLRGKIPYMSPEQLIMGNHPDHRSDLFSLGLVLYETLTAERLFNTQEEVIAVGKNSKWLKKTLKTKRLPAALEKILFKSLETDMARRYQSANHMYIDLLQYLISCNETGELMDSLGDFVNELFENEKLTPNGVADTLSSNEIQEELSKSSPSRPLIPNRWDSGKNNHSKSVSTEFSRPIVTRENRTSHLNTLYTGELGGDEEELKTVIDVIRISARNSKKRLLQFALALVSGTVLFGVLDTINGWTKAGVWMYDQLFPPAIEIVTVPPSARIFIDDQKIPGRTPLAIDDISPGVHKLQLEIEGYRPIVKSLFVPREGAIRVQGGGAENSSERSYLFRFNTEIQVDSYPPDANVFINGIPYNQKTPCTISWEVGTPLTFELEHAGFERLTGYTLNTLEGFDVVEDRRFWEMRVLNDDYTSYAVKGLFRKQVVFNTVPPGVEVVDLKTNSVVGVSGGAPLILPAGRHEVELRKRNFIPQKMTLQINEKFNEKISAVLYRNVQFRAFDELEVSRRDIGAQLVILRRGSTSVLRARRTTPFELALLAYSHTAVFQKEGYQRTEVVIAPDQLQVEIEMEPLRTGVEVRVVDALSNLAIPGAEIYYNFVDSPQTADIFLDQTDAFGQGFGQIAPGNYILTVKKTGYRPLTKTLVARSGDATALEFKIYPSNQ